MWADSLRELKSRIARLFRREQFESEMADELQLHIELQTEQLVAEGMSEATARRQALIQFGGIEQTREQCRDHLGIRLMSDFLHDLRYAVRTLLRSPGFTIVAAVTLALGIGANTAVFSVVNTLLLQPLPFEEPERIVMFWQQNTETGFDQDQVAWADYFDWQAKSTTIESFDCVVNSTAVSRNFMMWSGGDVTRIRGRHVSSSLFDVLGAQPLLGQTLQADDDEPGGPRRAVISFTLWKQAFGGDQQVVGKLLDLDRDAPTFIDVGGEARFEIVGVMPPDFRFPQDADVWLSIAGWGNERRLRGTTQRRDAHGLWVVGRMRDGTTIEQVNAELNTIQRQIADDPQNRNIIRLASEVVVTPLLDQVNGRETKPALWMLMGAVAFVLLIACANVANLLLARAMSRRREIAIRVALGAGRARVVRQLLTESLLLSLVGASVGSLFAVWGIRLLELIHTDAAYLGVKEFRFDRLADVTIDPAVLGFTVLVSVVTGVVFGLIPAVQASRLNVNATLKEDSRAGTASRATQLLRSSLLISEVALALVLLVGAGVALRSFSKMISVDVGMQPDNVIRVELDLDMAGKVYGLDAEGSFDKVVSQLNAVPGVLEVSGCGETPLTRSGWNDTFKILGQHDELAQAELPSTDVRLMGPGAFQTLGIPLIAGREFTTADDSSVPSVIVINDALRRRFFGDVDPIGKTIQFRGWRGHKKTVVGVVGSIRNYSDSTADQPEMYFPLNSHFLPGPKLAP